MTLTEIIETDGRGQSFALRPMECPTCGAAAGKTFVGWRGGKYHRYGLGIVTRIVQCRGCGLLYPDPFPYPLHPQEIYGDPESYFESHDPAAKQTHFSRLVAEAVQRCETGGRMRLLDVGSGRGELLVAAREAGLEAVGLEFSDAMIDAARTRHGVTVLKQSIEDFAAGGTAGRFDCVILNAVLEHVYDPDAMVSAAAALVPSGGVLYIDIPVEPSLLTRVGGLVNRLRGSRAVLNLSPTFSPYHVFGFNRRSLTRLLDKHGFEVESLKVFATPSIPHGPALRDRTNALVGTQINRIANWTGQARNMFVWARRR